MNEKEYFELMSYCDMLDGNARPPQNDWQGQWLAHQREKRRVRRLGNYSGLGAAGFFLLSNFIILALRKSSFIMDLYASSSEAALGIDLIITLFSIGLPFLLCYFLLEKVEPDCPLPLGKPQNLTTAGLLFFSCWFINIFGSYIASVLASSLETFFGVEFYGGEISLPSSAFGVLLYVVRLAVLPAIIEEFAFRGVIMQHLRRYGDGFAILMSAILFAILHGNMIQIPFALIAGCTIGYAVIVTGSLWTGIAIHFANNILSVVQTFFLEEASEVESVLTLIPVLIILIGGIVCTIILKKENRLPKLNKLSPLSRSEAAKSFLSAPVMLCLFAYTAYVVFTMTSAYKPIAEAFSRFFGF